MFHIKYTMTFAQASEYFRLKEKSPKMSDFDLFVALFGSGLCLGKTITTQLGLLKIAKVIFFTSKGFFWILIICSFVKGIDNLCNSKTRKTGIGQIIGSAISSVLMLL